MRLSVLCSILSALVIGAGASAYANSPVRANPISRPVVQALHNAFTGAKTLKVAEFIAQHGQKIKLPTGTAAKVLAQELKKSCQFANLSASKNSMTETIKGTSCPINSTSQFSWTRDNDKMSGAMKATGAFAVTDSNLAQELSIVAESHTQNGTFAHTKAGFHTEGISHIELATVQNHKIVVDSTSTMDATVTKKSNGKMHFQIQSLAVNGTFTFDGQKHVAAMMFESGTNNKNFACTLDNAPVSCHKLMYMFGGGHHALSSLFSTPRIFD